MKQPERIGLFYAFFICLLLSSLSAAALAQEYDIRTARKLRLELWSIFERAGIQPANLSGNLTDDQIKTLASIDKVNDYPIYTMTYYGGYGFDEFLKVGHPPGAAAWNGGRTVSIFVSGRTTRTGRRP